jgi:hypothetical protein
MHTQQPIRAIPSKEERLNTSSNKLHSSPPLAPLPTHDIVNHKKLSILPSHKICLPIRAARTSGAYAKERGEERKGVAHTVSPPGTLLLIRRAFLFPFSYQLAREKAVRLLLLMCGACRLTSTPTHIHLTAPLILLDLPSRRTSARHLRLTFPSFQA